MDKIWFILIDDRKEGPFSKKELRRDPRITPDTLVWKEGFKDWKRIRDVRELKEIFEEEGVQDSFFKKNKIVPGQETLCIDTKKDPSFFYALLIALFVLLYILYRYNKDV